MGDAGWGPALPRPLRACDTAHDRGAGLPGVSRALSRGGSCADARGAGVRRGVLRVEGQGRALLLARESDPGRGGLPTVGAKRRLRLVDWFNGVDATYRTELRELNELNFGRFDAKLEALESRLEARMAAFEARIIRWMFLFWVGQAVTTVGLVFGVVRLTGR